MDGFSTTHYVHLLPAEKEAYDTHQLDFTWAVIKILLILWYNS